MLIGDTCSDRDIIKKLQSEVEELKKANHKLRDDKVRMWNVIHEMRGKAEDMKRIVYTWLGPR